MKKTNRLRLLSGIASVALLASYLMPLKEIPTMLTANADNETVVAHYGKAYTIENILSDYNYFVQGDTLIGTHTVGAIAVGGNATITNFGDAAATPCYFNNLQACANFNPGAYIIRDTPEGQELYEQFIENAHVYYHNANPEGVEQYLLEGQYFNKLADDCDFINFDVAFEEISNWSSKKAADEKNSYVFEESDLDAAGNLNIDIQSAKYNMIIPADVYGKIKNINFHGNITELASSGYTISIPDVKEVTLAFGNNINYYDENGESVNGSNVFTFADRDAGINQSHEVNVDLGMNFVWNLPDAETVRCLFQAGHIVAPKADYFQSGGQMEGGVIAKTVDNKDSEAHFYPYRSMTKQNSAYQVELFKYIDEINGKPLANALLGAYPVNDSGIGTSPAFKLKTGESNPNYLGMNPSKYIIKEIRPPMGYMTGGEEYYIEIVSSQEKEATIELEKESWGEKKDGTIKYTDKVIITVYSDPEFTTPIETITYSPLAVAENTYTVGEKRYAFKTDADNNVVAVYEVKDDGTREDVTEAELDNFIFNTVENADVYYNLFYNDEILIPENGYYTIDGVRYDITVDDSGNITQVIKKGETLGEAECKRFQFGQYSQGVFGGYWQNTDTLYYYDKDVSAPGAKLLDQAKATEDGIFTFETIGKSYQVISTPAGWNTPPAIETIIETDVDVTEGFSIEVKTTSANYIVVRRGEVAKAKINLSSKLNTKFEFVNSESLTLRKVDAAEPTRELKGAHFAFVEEQYQLTKGREGELTYQSSNPEEAVDGEYSESHAETDASIVGFTWDKNNSSTAFSARAIHSMYSSNWMGPATVRIYRLTETIAPKGYDLPENDILLACHNNNNNRTYLMLEVPRGTILTKEQLPINENGGLKPDKGGWTTLDFSTAEGRTITVADHLSELRLQISKQDAATHALVAGATIELWAENGTEAIKTIQTENGVTPLLDNENKTLQLTPGVYYIVETDVPEGYLQDQKDVKHYFTILSDLTVVKGITREISNSDGEKHSITQMFVTLPEVIEESADVTVTVVFEDGTEQDFTKTIEANGQGEVRLFHQDENDGKQLENVVGIRATSTAPIDILLNVQDNTWNNISSRSGLIPAGSTVGFGKSGLPPIVESDGSDDEALILSKALNAYTLSLANQPENVNVQGDLKITKSFDGLNVTDEEKAGALTFEITTGEGENMKWLKKDGTLSDAEVKLTLGADFTKNEETGIYELIINNVAFGTYTVKETNTAVEGYNFVTGGSVTEGTVELTANDNTKTVEIVNKYEQKTGDLKITKTVDGLNITEEEFNGALTFTVQNKTTGKYLDADGKLSDKAVEITLKEFTKQTDGTYVLEFSGVELGEYEVIETNTDIAGYTLKSTSKTDGTATVEDGKESVIELKDEYSKDTSTLTISKTDLGANPIPDTNKAEFKLTAMDKDANLDGVKVEGKTLTDKDTDVTFKGNKAEITGLKDGKYTLEETVAPDGFVTITTFEFEIKDGKVVTDSVKTETNGNVIVKDDNTIEVQDAPTTLTISKTDLGANPIPDTNKAEFKLTAMDKDANLDGVKVEGKTLTDKDTEVTFNGNKAEITGLKDGKYALEETVAPDGFVTITTFEFEIKDGKVVTDSVKTETNGNVIVKDDNTIEVQDAPTTLTISKTDLGANPIPDTNKAEFKLTAMDKDANLDGVKVEGKTLTDKDTDVTFKGNKAEITGLKDGKYTLEETVAPDGFVTITTFEFEIKDGKVVTDSVKTETNGNVIVKDDNTIEVQDAPKSAETTTTTTSTTTTTTRV